MKKFEGETQINNISFRNCKQFQTYERSMLQKRPLCRDARWFVFKPKIPIWVNFGEPLNGKCWYISWPLEHSMVIWYNLWPFGIVCRHLFFFPIRCVWTKKNLATLPLSIYSVGKFSKVFERFFEIKVDRARRPFARHSTESSYVTFLVSPPNSLLSKVTMSKKSRKCQKNLENVERIFKRSKESVKGRKNL
jgi:hypothetical protein